MACGEESRLQEPLESPKVRGITAGSALNEVAGARKETESVAQIL